MKTFLSIITVFTIIISPFAFANNKQLISTYVSQAPIIDGKNTDNSWSKATAIITRDLITKKDITIKSIHTNDHIYILVQYPDSNEERQHKTLFWDETLEMYKAGPEREDSFVIKWSMEVGPIDLSLSSNRPYQADIWYWKAARTDHAGYADDKMHNYSLYKQKKTKQLLSKSGRLFYLSRTGDKGKSAYSTVFQDNYSGKRISRFIFRKPEGSRADVRAKGNFKNGVWTIEFARKLTTGHNDDVSFNLAGKYQFGVSIYEIAGRGKEVRAVKPLFGGGEISESLLLMFNKN
ncbi:MAG: hypothetical protein HQL71_00340 [Magnetococcales bacterium]|nr:hypothetical protein [Magnetococcales bacterium]